MDRISVPVRMAAVVVVAAAWAALFFRTAVACCSRAVNLSATSPPVATAGMATGTVSIRTPADRVAGQILALAAMELPVGLADLAAAAVVALALSAPGTPVVVAVSVVAAAVVVRVVAAAVGARVEAPAATAGPVVRHCPHTRVV